MRTKLFLMLVLVLVPAGLQAQRKDRELPTRPAFHEEAVPRRRATDAPADSLRQVRTIIHYVMKTRPDLATDTPAQQRFLSKRLRDAFARRQKVYADFVKKNETPDPPPGNIDFVGSWDYPTSFRIVGSRVYDQRAIVDVLFTWGKNTNYEGDTRLTSYSLIREQGGWKLEDIYTFDGKFSEARSLLKEFLSKTYE
jgi:hypothetical protein